MFVINSRPY